MVINYINTSLKELPFLFQLKFKLQISEGLFPFRKKCWAEYKQMN